MLRGTSPQQQAGLRREVNRRDAPAGQQARSTSAVSPPPALARVEPRAASVAGSPIASLNGPSGHQRKQVQLSQWPSATGSQQVARGTSIRAGRPGATGSQQAAALSTQDSQRGLSSDSCPRSSPAGIATPPRTQAMVLKAPSTQATSLPGSFRQPSQPGSDVAQVTAPPIKKYLGSATMSGRKPSETSSTAPPISPSNSSSQKGSLVKNQELGPMLDRWMDCHWDSAPPASPKPEDQTPLQNTPAWRDTMMAHGRSPSPPTSEAPSSVVQSCMRSVVIEGALNLDRLSLEERVQRLENSLDEKLIKATSEVMNACVTLCKHADDRFGRQMEALRLEVSQLQQATLSAQKAALASTDCIDRMQQVASTSIDRIDRIAEEPPANAIEGLRSDLLQELHSTISQEVSSLRFELAARGVPVTAGLPSAPDLEALTPLGFQGQADQPRKTGIAGLVGVISDCVVAKMKEDPCIKSAAEQQDQIKEVIQELRNLPSGPSSNNSSESKNEVENLHGMVKEMVKISYSLAQEISSERQQRSRDFCEAQERLAAVEQGLPQSLSPPQGDRSLSASTRQRAAVAKRSAQGGSTMGTVGNGGSLERVIGGLQRLADQDDLQRPPQINPTQRSSSQQSRGSPPPSGKNSQGSQDENSNWSTEVRALRSRLENIFQVGGSKPDLLANSGSTVVSGTVGSLPTVQEGGA